MLANSYRIIISEKINIAITFINKLTFLTYNNHHQYDDGELII